MQIPILDKIYQVITQVNQSEQDKHPEVLTGPTILGPQIEKNGRYSFRIAMTAQNGHPDDGLSYLL